MSGGTGLAGLQTWALSQKRCDPEVVMYSTTGTPVARYHLENAWPSKLEISGLVASKNEVAIESLTLAAEGIRRDVPAVVYQKQCDAGIANGWELSLDATEHMFYASSSVGNDGAERYKHRCINDQREAHAPTGPLLGP